MPALAVLAIVVGAGVAWQFRGAAARLLSTGASSEPEPAQAAPRKCLVQGQVTYTNGACPAGSREQGLSGGTLTIVPGERPSAPAAPASGPRHVRDLLLDSKGADIKDKMMDRAIQP